MYIRPSDLPEDPKEAFKMLKTAYKLMFYDMLVMFSSRPQTIEIAIAIFGTNGMLLPLSGMLS